MADTKTSALTAVGTPAGTDEIHVNQGGTSKKETLAQVKTFVNTAPVFAAGTASAGTWPVLTAGTVLTTPEVGALELDATNLYGCTDAGNRGYIPIKHFIRANATRTLPNNTNENAIFNSPTNGRLTLEAGTYLFAGLISVSSMSATSGNALLDILGAGTAVCNDWLWHAVGADGNANTAATQTGSTTNTQQSAASILTAGTGSSMHINVKGTFTVTTAGTIIPSIDQVTAAAAVVAIGSYMTFERIGDASVVSVGQWD